MFEDDNNVVTKDANWNILKDWDSVIAIKDLKWKWVKIKSVPSNPSYREHRQARQALG